MNEKESLLVIFGFLPDEKITISAYLNQWRGEESELIGSAVFFANNYGELLIRVKLDEFQNDDEYSTLFHVTGENSGMVDPYLEYRYKGFTDPFED